MIRFVSITIAQLVWDLEFVFSQTIQGNAVNLLLFVFDLKSHPTLGKKPVCCSSIEDNETYPFPSGVCLPHYLHWGERKNKIVFRYSFTGVAFTHVSSNTSFLFPLQDTFLLFLNSHFLLPRYQFALLEIFFPFFSLISKAKHSYNSTGYSLKCLFKRKICATSFLGWALHNLSLSCFLNSLDFCWARNI